MSAPTLVDPTGQNNQQAGSPIIVGAARYVATFDTVGPTIQMFKCTTLGTWTLMDGPNSPASGGVVTSCEHAGLIFVVSTDATASFVTVSIFDTSSDIWTSSTITVNPTPNQIKGAYCIYRVFDDQLIVYMPEGQTLTPYIWSKGGYFLFDPIALTARIWVETDAFMTALTPTGHHAFRFAAGMVQGNGRVHLFISGIDVGNSIYNLYQVALDDGGTLGTPQLIDINSDIPATLPFARGDGNVIVVGVGWNVGGSDFTTVTYYSATVAASDSQSFTKATVSAPGNLLGSLAFAFFSASTFLLIAYTDPSSFLTQIGYFQDSGGGLGAMALVGIDPTSDTYTLDGAVNDPVGGFGVLMDDFTGLAVQLVYWPPGVSVILGYATSGGSLVGIGAYATC